MNTNVESGAESDGGLVDCGAVWEMEVVWPSEAVLRKKASNHHEGRWLKTVVLSVVGKGVAGLRQVWTGKMSDERKFSVVDVSKLNQVTSEPRPEVSLGMSLGDIRLLPRRCPAYGQHEPGLGSRTERVKACPDTDARDCPGREGGLQAAESARSRVPMRGALADSPVVAVIRLRIAVGGGAKGRGRPGSRMRSTVREEPHE